MTDVGEACSANGQPGKILAIFSEQTAFIKENEHDRETLSAAILSFATTATTSKIASFLNAQCGLNGDIGQSAACLVVQEQSHEHETAVVTSSAQVK